MNYKRKVQRPSKQTDKMLAVKIIRLANRFKHKYKDKFYYKIAKELSIRIERVKVCLKHAIVGGKNIFSNNKPWKPYTIYFYDIKKWEKNVKKNKSRRNEKNVQRSLERSREIIEFIEKDHNSTINLPLADGTTLERYVRRSVCDYLHRYEMETGKKPPVGKSTIYKHIENEREGYKRLYFVRLFKQGWVKIARKNFPKLPYMTIDERPEIPINEVGHYQADSVIGKLTDKMALATTLDVNTGWVTISLYDRKAISFAECVSKRIKSCFKSLTIDNGSENSKLGNYLPIDRIYTCHAYSSWEKGAIESMHRLIRMIWPKGKSMDLLTSEAVKMIEIFVNTYFRPRYQEMKRESKFWL